MNNLNLNELSLNGQFSIDQAHAALLTILPDLSSTFDDEEVILKVDHLIL